MDPQREQQIEAGGKTYTLVFGNRALRLIERELGKPVGQMDEDSISDLTVMIWAGLQRHHPALTVNDVDDIIDDVGYAAVGEIAGKALAAAMPQETEPAQGNGNRAQRRARAAGTGTPSPSKA